MRTVLARAQLKMAMRGKKFINRKLSERFPEWIVESIKGQRNKNASYKRILDGPRAEEV